MENSLIIILVTILGLIFGSFFACMGYRIPNKIKITETRSFCPKCNKKLKWYMNIPVFSFIFLKGKCHFCKEPINFIYPFVEITTAALFLCNYLLFDFGYNFWISTILSSALMITIVSDFMYYYISDRVLALSAISLIIVMSIFKGYEYVLNNVIYAVIIFIIMIGIKLLGNKILKKESLGDGDIKLLAVIGLAVGLLNGLISLFIGSALALIYAFTTKKKNKDGIVPFGPFLLIGSIMTLYFSSYISYLIENLIYF